MRRTKSTSYGQRGGDSPIAGRKAVTFVTTLPDGAELRGRFFKDVPDCAEGVAVVLPSWNGRKPLLWVVRPTEADARAVSYVAAALRDRAKGGTGSPILFLPCKRVGG